MIDQFLKPRSPKSFRIVSFIKLQTIDGHTNFMFFKSSFQKVGGITLLSEQPIVNAVRRIS